jgi:hypothetical protein
VSSADDDYIELFSELRHASFHSSKDYVMEGVRPAPVLHHRFLELRAADIGERLRVP